MWSLQRDEIPFELTEINQLKIKIIATWEKPAFKPIVCIGLDGVILFKIDPLEESDQPEGWFDGATYVEYEEAGIKYQYLIRFRPILAKLLIQLNRYTVLVVYSSQSKEFVEAVLKVLNIKLQKTHPSKNEDKFAGIQDAYFWSRDQCIKKKSGFIKSLGAVNEYSMSNINDIWLIDDKPELVDFPSRVICVEPYTGDPRDVELLRLIHQIFNND